MKCRTSCVRVTVCVREVDRNEPVGRSGKIHALGFALQEESRVVIIRFGHDWDQVCMQMDEVRN